MRKVLVAGGAGFIGSHIVDYLMSDADVYITVYDNLTSGKATYLGKHLGSDRLTLVEGDLKDRAQLVEASRGQDSVYHFASNPDIARAIAHPDVDFWEGTYLTQNILEAMRVNRIRSIVYASGSGVYGDAGGHPVTEDHSPMLPISPYGASKLACEAMIHAYCHMFGIVARIFRFANVVGPRQTHGVALDFCRRLAADPTTLKILGDGSQTKSYIDVEDVVHGIHYFSRRDREQYTYYHLATDDYISVREIADLACDTMGLSTTRYEFTNGRRGWAGDVPVVRFDLTKVHAGGWAARYSSRQALQRSISAILSEFGYEARR